MYNDFVCGDYFLISIYLRFLLRRYILRQHDFGFVDPPTWLLADVIYAADDPFVNSTIQK